MLPSRVCPASGVGPAEFQAGAASAETMQARRSRNRMALLRPTGWAPRFRDAGESGPPGAWRRGWEAIPGSGRFGLPAAPGRQGLPKGFPGRAGLARHAGSAWPKKGVPAGRPARPAASSSRCPRTAWGRSGGGPRCARLTGACQRGLRVKPQAALWPRRAMGSPTAGQGSAARFPWMRFPGLGQGGQGWGASGKEPLGGGADRRGGLRRMERVGWERPGASDGGRAVGTQIVSCDSAHIVPDTGRVRFSRSFVGEPGSPASLRHLSHCLGGPSGIDAEACLARIISFRQEPPSGPV